MSLGTVEHVSPGPLASAIETAFERLRSADASTCALVFDAGWQPTMDVVDLVAQGLRESEGIQMLTLVHPSAAMAFIASAVSTNAGGVTVTAQRSVYDELEDENTDATASKTMFVMEPAESLERFVRRSVAEARHRAVRRFALLFDGKSTPTMDLAGLLAEELLQSGVQEVGLVHPAAPLEALAAALRLRLPGVRVAFAGTPKRG